MVTSNKQYEKGIWNFVCSSPWKETVFEKQKFLRQSRVYSNFMRSEILLLCSYKPTTLCMLSQMNTVRALSSRCYNIHLISSRPSLGLPSFSFSFPTKPSAHYYYFPYVTHIPQNFRPCFNHSNIIGEHFESLSFSLCNAIRRPVTPSFLDTYKPSCLSTWISNNLNLRSYFHVRDKILPSYKTGDKITRLCILGKKGKTRDFGLDGTSIEKLCV